MRNRHITNNIRLVLDILDYPELVKDDSFILFVDFYKAFDSVEHEFIFESLKKFGFGDYFSNAIKTLYKNNNSSIKLMGGSSSRFPISRGIRQGCPVSPYLFLVVSQLLASHIKASTIEGISIIEKKLIITQLADDTTLFLQNDKQIPTAIRVIEEFSKASGVYLNLTKCELLAIKDCSENSYCDIPVKSEINYLGILLHKNQQNRCSLNFNPIMQRTQKKLNQWLVRDLSLRGRVLLTKAEGISRLTYAALALHVDNKVTKEVDKMLFNFIWRCKIHYIKKTVIMNSYENGGLNVLDFDSLNNTFKINWMAQFIRSPNSIWNVIPFHIFSKLGGIEFFLACNYGINKIPINLSNFHRQALLAWKLIYKHNFSPHRYFIWNNQDILYKQKTLFFENWFQNNIVLVDQLFDADGFLFTYDKFMRHYNIPIPPGEFAKVFGAISDGVCMLFKQQRRLDYNHLPPFTPIHSFVGEICFSSHYRNNNKPIRALFQKDIVTQPKVISYWNRFVNDVNWKKVWLLPNRFFVTNKIKEVTFKLIHRIYPVKCFLVRYKRNIDVNCSFCDSSKETAIHLFWYCNVVAVFWQHILDFIVKNIDKNFALLWKNVLLGLFVNQKDKQIHTYMINFIILMAKFHIHKCKFSGRKPCFKVFKEEIVHYVDLILPSKNQKACQILKACNYFHIFI